MKSVKIRAEKGLKSVEELILKLESIGLSADQCARVRERYDGNLDGLTMYVLLCMAMFDDRHEYVD